MVRRALPPPPTKEAKPFRRFIREMERGKLADFKPFDLIARVWLFRNRGVPPATGNEQVDAETMGEYAELPRAETALAKKLLDAVVSGDSETLRRTADVVDQLSERPGSNERFVPHFREKLALLRFASTHDTSSMTTMELFAWFTKRHFMEEKTFRRWVARLEIPTRVGRPGPRAGS